MPRPDRGADTAGLLARTRAAAAAMRAGRHAEAVDGFRAVVRASPRMPDAHNNLAIALRAAGDLDGAVQAYRKAIKLDSRYGVAHRNLGRVLRQLGRSDEALPHMVSARRLLGDAPDAAEVERELFQTLAGCRFGRPSPVGRQLLSEAFGRDDLELAPLGAAAVRLLAADPRLGRALQRARAVVAGGGDDPGFPAQAPREPLLDSLLAGTVVASPDIECWVTLVRRRLLERVAASQPVDWPEESLAALAAQCEMTEFCYRETAAERAMLAEIAARGGPDRPTDTLVAAMYRPLGRLRGAEALRPLAADDGRPILRALLARSLDHPATEARIAAALPVLALSEDGTSAAVRDQYEHNPYPRWLSVDRDPPRRFADYLGERLQGERWDGLDLDHPSILVAGCGTGRHAITTARRDLGSRVLAVDLSRRSLAYAARRAGELGVGNVRFAQADILGLSALDDRFDLIECSGVLHHMADPLAGWRVLRGLLKPGGLMRIGLYSRLARGPFDRFRAPPPVGADPEAVADAIRTRRAEVMALDESDPACILRHIGDFYSTSGCRDLLFHAQEVVFTLPGVARALSETGMDFLAFERLPEAVTQAFRREHPGSAETDLAAWHAFEQRHPETFIAMYQFWCRARG